MKLILAIIHDEDAQKAIEKLSEKGHFITKLASTGGFLRAGNTTLITGVADENVEDVIAIFEKSCHSRTQLTTLGGPYGAMEGFMPHAIEVKVGGATIFVMEVAQFRKV